MRRVILWLSLALIVSLWLSAPVGAKTKFVYAERFDADLTLLPNGDLQVVETLQIVFQGGPFHYGYRIVPGDRLDDIANIEVWEGNQRYQPGNNSAEYTFRAVWQDGDLQVYWYFPYTSDSTHTFEFRYTTRGVVRRYDEGDEVWWMGVPDDHDYAINNSRVTLHLPQGAQVNLKDGGDGFVVDSDGVRATVTVSEDRRAVTAVSTEILGIDEFLALRAKFTPGVVSGGKPDWQAAYDRKAEWARTNKPKANLCLGALGLLALIIAPLLVLVLWYTRGRDPQVGLVSDYLAEPPDDTPPGVVGTLVDEKADLQDIVATLVDLARRGYLTMTEEAEKGFAGLTFKRDFVFERTDKRDGLRVYEHVLLLKLFDSSSRKRLSDMKNLFYSSLPEIRNKLYDEVVEAGYIRSRPDKTRQSFVALGVVAMILAIAVGVGATVVLIEWVDTVWCPAVGLLAGAALLIVVSPVMPVKTQEGAEAAARWRAFRQYLKEIERYTDLETASELFDRYLPYAIAFNLERRWVQKFARVESTPIPGWYHPYGMGRHSGRRHGAGGRGLEGGATPSMQGMSDGLAGGLQGMSDGLVSMFNSVGKTMTSAPSSSSSGGGFSGGGFSGGGFSGGGSSGFG